MKAMQTAATGMEAQTLRIDTIANNLANADTTGFKKSQVDFADLMYLTMRWPGGGSTQVTQTPTGLQVGSGVFPVSTLKIFTEGAVNSTDGQCDMAINGPGFFQVETPSGATKYTRDGNFRVSADGLIVNSQGFPLYPNITIPQETTSISIGSDGTVSAQAPDGTASVAGQVQLANFRNPGGLSSEGSNLLAETIASGAPLTGTPGSAGFGDVKQGYLEASNVDVVNELVDLIMAQRTYELNSKVVKAGDHILQTTNQIAG
jgi:flagellar basal-body rod protein FlgG